MNQHRLLLPMLLNEVFGEVQKVQRDVYNQLPKYPPIDTYLNKDGENVIEIATTFKPEDIKVDVEDNLITITGENSNKEDETRVYLHKSISKKSFIRAFKTDFNIDKKSVIADFENGLLKISFKPKESKKVSINVNSSNKNIETNLKGDENE